jgi:hypothetical protein
MSINASPLCVADSVLIAAIQARLAERGIRARSVALDRSPSRYATSAALENVTVTLDDGSTRDLILKDMNPDRSPAALRRTKPPFVIDPRRELSVYQTILMPRQIGAAVYGAGTSDDGTGWLLLERVAGVELYQVGDLDGWVAAAAWLAAFHDSVHPLDQLRTSANLIEYTADYYTQWLQRALTFFRDDAPPSRFGRDGLHWLASHFDEVVARVRAWPRTLIHGDYNASNVLVQRTRDGWAVCPIDWEMAALGPGILDLAAITSGNWSEPERRKIIAGYVGARGAAGPSLDETADAVDYAQIYLSVQWLGWFGRRRPPAEHSRDWLADALERAARLQLGN